jgi:hypothetical protein
VRHDDDRRAGHSSAEIDNEPPIRNDVAAIVDSPYQT